MKLAFIGTLGLIGALLVGEPTKAQPAEAEPRRWAACPAEVITAPFVAQCTTVTVPLDYRDPDGATIDLMVSRIAATDPAKRRGILMFNPGGPGGTGLDQPAFLLNKGMPASVLASYDLIGMDTRGVGHSSPVSCGFTADDAYWANIPPYAGDTAAVTAQSKIAAEVAQRCAANDTDGRLRHLTTANTARDLDRIRAALGEKKASFYGASYGSALGAAYVSLFPDSTDRIVLDSNLADTHLDRDSLRRYARGFEETFPDFAAWAAQRHTAYGLGQTPAAVRRTFVTLAERLDRTPTADGFNGAHLRYLTFAGLYHPIQYGATARLWQSMLNPATAPVPTPETPGAPSPVDNALTVYLAVTCNDVAWPKDLATYQRDVETDRERYPLFGAAAANIMPCAYWKHEPAEPPVKVDAKGPANVLLLQNRHDPVTPAVNAELLQRKFGKRARLVTTDGSGHGVYVLSDNACALNLTTSYLVDGRMPTRDTTCRA
ncbi:alpha/beta hydrolase [Actinoplanes couchii]|uniref:Alpha/beta hydrolase n=1 Tax=Actinoplanes couchii TaxID=403638 RepID=A0ABQ3X837_9ACTN|nr:alpha/beta hydrolase [Actinoplanes couchii]MDR6320319.1 pimeloyl-ACP methyl ester carboxylesterase [Actinoplanes couchii]GID54667.1 alpha/beta hydrolase [Actinoplanes couchii]